MGGSDVAQGSLVTDAKCRCVYRRDVYGTGLPACVYPGKPLTQDKHEIQIVHEALGDMPVLAVTKKSYRQAQAPNGCAPVK